jgi:hypothetical protein
MPFLGGGRRDAGLLCIGYFKPDEMTPKYSDASSSLRLTKNELPIDLVGVALETGNRLVVLGVPEVVEADGFVDVLQAAHVVEVRVGQHESPQSLAWVVLLHEIDWVCQLPLGRLFDLNLCQGLLEDRGPWQRLREVECPEPRLHRLRLSQRLLD